MILGFGLVLVAAFFQGTFLLPMAMTRKWAWEHSWAVFCLFAMLLLNWVIALVMLPNPLAVASLVPRHDLLILALFGAGWGVGAVLFGLGMDRLGMALGYPLIMGLNAAVGALIPLIWMNQASLFSYRSIAVSVGIGLAILGIITCSLAGARKESTGPRRSPSQSTFACGLLIAIAAGCLCCLPNIGMASGKSTIQAAKNLGASENMAGNAVWAVFFTLGGLINLAYCAFLMAQKGNFRQLAGSETLRNLGLGLAMSLMWIGSFYFFGVGASQMGQWGSVIGWPILMSGSIAVGCLWGLWKGEWKSAPAGSLRLLLGGLLLISLSVSALGYANSI